MVSAGAAAQVPNPQPPRPQRQVLALNSERLTSIGHRIRDLCHGTAPRPSAELLNLVYALARGVDFAVSAGDVPAIAGEMPGILRKVYELRKEPYIQSAVMVLVISCKNACSNKWFRPTDSADILRMANELSGGFCTSHGQAANYITVLEIISKIMPRYYPQLKFERLVTSIEAKAGYDVLMADFFVERNLPQEEKIRLIVVEKENLDASSCITNPSQVSFLVNGKGVEMRTNVSMEKGPQFPTDITKMLKYGANIIQAVGYFNANYVIAVAFMKSLTSFGAPPLDDYAEPVTVDSSDSDVLEGPSRVSLRCPISLRRIKTPIKGHLCKHYQCFDYDNYIEINLIKPTWRCPCCNTPSNFMELRIDHKMTKILHETEDDVLDVLLFADGSWKAAQGHNEKSDRDNVDAIAQTAATVQTESCSSSSHVIDLINGDDDDLAMIWTSASEDTKPVLSCQDLSVLDHVSGLPISGPAQADQMGSNMASTSQTLLLSSSSGLVSSSFGTLEPLLPQNALCPIITDAVSPLGTLNSTSVLQHISQETHSETVHLQPQIRPGVSAPIHRNPRSEAVGVQELPVPPQNSGLSRGLQPTILNSAPFVPSPTSTYQAHQVTNPSSVISPVNSGGGPSPRAPSAALIFHPLSSTLDQRNTSNHLPSRVSGLPAPHLMAARQFARAQRQTGGANACRSMPIRDEFMLNSQVNQMAQAAGGQTRAAAQVGPTLMDIQNHLFSGQHSQASRPQTEPQSASPAVAPRVPSLLQSSNETTVTLSTPETRASDGLPELPVHENWRPTGQMRGSLTGNAYSHAIERYLGQTAQQQSRARPPNA